jgi:hypothetical protein
MTARLVRGYLFFLMVGLFVQGVGSLLFRLVSWLPAHSPLLVRGAFGIDFSHSWIHIVWGAAGVVVLVKRPDPRSDAWLAFTFGVFYTSFAILGVTIHHPLGLQLDAFENGFHLVAGPLTLLVGVLALRSSGQRASGQPSSGQPSRPAVPAPARDSP